MKKYQLLAAVLLIVLLGSLFAGCTASNAQTSPVVGQYLDAQRAEGQKMPAQQNSQTDLQPTAAEPGKLTKEEAEAIALKHAGLNAGDVILERTEYDINDGVPVYEIEFRHGKWDYDYEIHAITGKILSWEQDD